MRWTRRNALSGLDDDIRDHIEREVEENLARGMTPEEARRQALRKFGNVALVKEDARAVWVWPWLAQLQQDLRYAVRSYARTPVLTAVVVATLALGIGANTAIFSVLYAVVLRPLPVHEPERLVELLSRYPGEPRMASFNTRAYEHYRDNNRVLSRLIAVGTAPVEMRIEGGARERITGAYVSGNHFPALGLQPALGRLLDRSDEDDRSAAVLSWAYWQRRFGGDPFVLGRAVIANNAPVTIVGVAPRRFTGLQTAVATDVWMVLPPAEQADGRPRMPFQLMGRLADGVSLEQAQAELQVLDRWRVEDLASSFGNPEWLQATLELESGRAGLSPLRDRFGRGLQVVMLLVVVLLGIACINIASLLLARGAARRQELAVRVTLGAGRIRLLRQVLTESLLLAISGGALGLVIAYFGAELLVGILTSGRPLMGLPGPLQIPVEPDVRVLSFAAGISIVTGVVFGLAPAWTAISAAPAPSLRNVGRLGAGRHRHLGDGLVVAQMALSVALLSVTGLLVSRLTGLQSEGLGFERDSRLLLRLDPSESGHSREELAARYDALLARLGAIPTVRSATLSGTTPIEGGGASRFIHVEGFVERPEGRRYVSLNWIAPRYFETLGTPLVAGRDFRPEDAGRPAVAIVNQAMARRYFADRIPLGQHFTFDGLDRAYEIIGVVADAKYIDLHQPAPPTVYLHALQEGRGAFSHVTLHTTAAPTASLPDVRRAVLEILGDKVRIESATTMADQMDATLVPERLLAWLSTWFGVLGAGLAAIGLYGRLAYGVTRRAREIGVRMALGATRGGVMTTVLKGAVMLVGAGLAFGVPVALLSTRLAGGVLNGLPPSAPPIAAATALMVAVALLATALPVSVAARIDPATALRSE